ncbi:MAG: molybdate ABC transporter substrate-binding protein [Xanthobacteraceae bacterium]|jgi:molybdate transport system substrate-binding protein
MSELAEIKVISGGAMRRFLTEAVPLFEAASGSKVAIRFGLTREMKAAIEAGAEFDIALLPRSAIDELMHAGKIAAGTATDIVRSLVGLMVRAGAIEPDIGSVEAFKSVLRRAKAISYSKGPSGLYVAELLERLGLATEMKDKTVFAIGRPVGEVIASGEAEIGMQQIIENQPVKGAHLVGPLPSDLTNYVMYSAGFAPKATDSTAARALVKFLASPEAVRIIGAKGMEPA